MPTSVVDQVFGRYDPVAPTGMQSQRPLAGGIRKQRAGGAPNLTDILQQSLQSPAKAAEKAMTDKLLYALATLIEVEERFKDLDNQLPRKSGEFAEMYTPRHEVYYREMQRLQDIKEAAQKQVTALIGPTCGPPFDLNAKEQEYLAEKQAAMLHERMQNLTTPSMEAEPSQPEPSFASTGNPRFLRDQLAQQNRALPPPDPGPPYGPGNPHPSYIPSEGSEEGPPQYTSLGAR
jgi:hypothetical protein